MYMCTHTCMCSSGLFVTLYICACRQLLEMMCKIANVLKARRVLKGDHVAIYMPMCPLAVASMLACARIGAVHRYCFVIHFTE